MLKLKVTVVEPRVKVVMTRFILRNALLGIVFVAGIVSATSQTNPTPFNLAGGNYSFTTWDAASTAGTYPTSMIFHVFDRRIEPFEGLITDPPKANWAQAYNLTADARINGEGANGVSFFQTAAANSVNCGFQGAAILALNTTGRANINVSFVSQVTATGTRPYNLRLQYRIGTTAAWTNAIGANGDYVQLVSATDGTTARTLTWMMPTSLENQSVVQLRWIYFQDGNGSGTRPRIRLDDITVTSDNPTASTASALRIMSIVPQSPTVGQAFTVMVRSTDALGAVRNVSTATTVQLSKASGAGSIGGTLSGTIAAGTNTIVFSNVTWNLAESGVSITASRTAGDVLSSHTSSLFTVQGPPAYAEMSGAWNQAWVGAPMNPITITVYTSSNTVDVNYNGPITFSKQSGPGVVSGTLTVNAIRGVATFTDLTCSAAGNVVLQFSVPGLPTQTLPTITVTPLPSLTTNIVPQYVMSSDPNGCNFGSNPIPFYALVTFTGLQPNTVYRYNVGASNVSGVPTSTGGGQNVHLDNTTMQYSYTGGKSLINNHSTFATGPGQTTRALWINIVPTNNLTFSPGQLLYWQVALGDHHGNLIRYYQLSQTSTLIQAGSASNQATLLGDRNSQLKAKNIVLIWDNTAGTGRPIGSALVQPHDVLVSFANTRYANDIQNQQGAWMSMVPNTFANGVRRIEERDAVTGNIVYSVISTDGNWNGISTNPSNTLQYATPGGAVTPIYIRTPYIKVNAPAAGDTLCSGVPYNIMFRADGMQNVRIDFSIDGGMTYSLVENNVSAASGMYTWVPPSLGFRGNCRIRITGVDRPNEVGVSGQFTLVEPLNLIGPVDDRNLCLGDDDTLIALVGGSAESYTWYKDGQVIPYATSPILYLRNAHYSTSGVYWCVVNGYGNCGDVTTNQAHIRVGRKTQIVNQTYSVPGIIGATATLWCETEFPDEVLSYQWYRGTTALAESAKYFGTKSNRLEIRNFAQADYGNNYYCVVTGVCQSATTRVIRVFPTGVYAEFVNATVSACSGGSVNVPAMVYSNPPGEQLHIEWWFNGMMLNNDATYSGANTSTLTINNVSPQLAGTYTVRVMLASNHAVMSESSVQVVISAPPTISTQPQSVAVCEGEATTLTVAVNGVGSVMYQWLLDGNAIAGANGSSYTISTMTADRAGTYSVQVVTACGSVTSNEADVTMKAATAISTQPPATLSVGVGETLTLTLTATGAGTVQYQWYKDGNALAGEVAPTFAKTAYAAGDAGQYWCEVTAECGTVTSDTTTVTTRPASSVNESVVGGAIVSRIAPNPTSTATSLSVLMSEGEFVSVNVVDAAGNLVLNVHNAYLPAGDNRLPIVTAALPSGVYSVQTVIGGHSNVQQLVVIK